MISPQDITLERGKVLVLTGRQGSGTNTLAKQVAARYGAFVEIHASELESQKLDFLADLPAVVIVHEFDPSCAVERCTIKRLVTTPRLTVKPAYKPAVRVPPPLFILCTFHEIGPDQVAFHDRRFLILRVDSDAKAVA